MLFRDRRESVGRLRGRPLQNARASPESWGERCAGSDIADYHILSLRFTTPEVVQEYPHPSAHIFLAMRTRLLQSKTALVERVEVRDVPRELAREDYSPDFQIAFPYRGRFVWHVQGDAVTSDPNQVLFIRGGEPFRVADPQPDGFGEVIITPNPASLRDAAQATGFDLERHPLFAARRRRATPDIQFQCALLLHGIRSDAGDEFGTTELLLPLLCDALQLTPPQFVPSAQTRRLINRTKDFLDAHVHTRLELAVVARAVGVSPAYLTDVFHGCATRHGFRSRYLAGAEC